MVVSQRGYWLDVFGGSVARDAVDGGGDDAGAGNDGQIGRCEMGYSTAMKAAGATIRQYKRFGSYQGDWWALVTYNNETGWVRGSYGSCSVCDAFESEFGDSNSHRHVNGDYISEYDCEKADPECEECQQLMKKLADFGREYLDSIITQEQAEKVAAENISWDTEAMEMLTFIRENKLEREDKK